MNQIRADKLRGKIVAQYIKQSGGITYMEEKIAKPPKLPLNQLFELKKPKKLKKKSKVKL